MMLNSNKKRVTIQVKQNVTSGKNKSQVSGFGCGGSQSILKSTLGKRNHDQKRAT